MTTEATPKVALITGAGSGIGRASAVALLRAGFSVVLAGRRREALQATVAEAAIGGEAEEVERCGSNNKIQRTLIVPTDVTQPSSVRNLFQKTMEQFGRLDVLFNNAGIGSSPDVLLEDLDYDNDWKSVIDTNVTGTFLCTQEAFKMMKTQTNPRGGRIINNGSISAHIPRPNSAPYTASKHAISGLTKSTCLDGRKYDIVCSQVDIGNAATSMTERMTTTGALQPRGDIIQEPTMNVRHVSDAILFMANLPLTVNIPFMTIMATQMPYHGRG